MASFRGFTFRGFTLPEWVRLFRWWLIHLAPTHDVTVETFNGLLTFSNKNWLIGKYLYVKKQHEEHEIRAACELLIEQGWLGGPAAGRTVINVGANIGMTCIGLIKAGYFDRALGFEPEPENFRLLEKNIEQNDFAEQIEAFRMALSSTAGDLTFELSPDNPGDHRVRQPGQPPGGVYREEKRRTIQVPGGTLDQFLEGRSGQDRIDALWVDIQGHEGHFFRGAQAALKRGIPVITEFWPYGLARAGTTPEDLVAILSPLFAHFWVIGSDRFKRSPIGEVGQLFEVYRGPRSFGLVFLEPHRLEPHRRDNPV